MKPAGSAWLPAARQMVVIEARSSGSPPLRGAGAGRRTGRTGVGARLQRFGAGLKLERVPVDLRQDRFACQKCGQDDDHV